MKFFHISHNDLDGYACQFASSKYILDGRFFNCNYGQEAKNAINQVLCELSKLDDNDEAFFLITDLNPTFTECKELHDKIEELSKNGKKIKLQLLDHHISGEKNAAQFDWYFLDVNRCAAKITYDYFVDQFGECNDCANFSAFIDCVNSVDIWLENSEYFEFGKVLMRMISGANEINSTLFADANRDYRFHLLHCGGEYLVNNKNNIELDNNVHFLKKRFLMIDDNDDTIDNLMSKRLVFMLKQNQENLSVFYGKQKGIVTFGLGNISIPANAFLKENSDFDFFIDVGKKGNVSMRAAGNLDVSKLCAKIANGGGHKNASGGRFDDFSENFNYDDVRKFVQHKLDTKG